MQKGFLYRVEKIGNLLPEPITLFFVFSVVLIIASAICAYFGISVDYQIFNRQSGYFENKNLQAISLLNADGLRFMVSSALSNFTGFLPLGVVFMAILGVGVADGSGFISASLKKLVKITPKRLVTAGVVFLGIISNVASSAGCVVLVPLGAVIFLSFKRHPVAGIAAAFAGVSGGWNANIMIGTSDPIFAGLSEQAARILDSDYTVLASGNLYFMFVSTFLITAIATIVTEKIIEPRLGEFKGNNQALDDITDTEKRGLFWGYIGFFVYTAIVFILSYPDNSVFSGIFMKNIIVFISIGFLLVGIIYGVVVGSIKNDSDIANMMSNSVMNIASFLVIMFFAAQFVAYFNYSNLGTIMAISGANFLKDIGFVGIPLISVFVIFVAFINLFVSIDSAKWAMMAPIFVPLFMQLGFSPELSQTAYRIGDSTTNLISPIMPYFALILTFVRRYDSKYGVGSLMSLMIPYSLFFLIGWTLLLVVWMMFGLPVGVDAPIHYQIGK